jgi:hypothetical protein
MGALGNLSKKNTVKTSNFYDFMLARLAKKASDPTVGICKCELTWARGLRRKEVEPPERSIRPGGLVIGIGVARLRPGPRQAPTAAVASYGGPVPVRLTLYGLFGSLPMFTAMLALSGDPPPVGSC